MTWSEFASNVQFFVDGTSTWGGGKVSALSETDKDLILSALHELYDTSAIARAVMDRSVGNGPLRIGATGYDDIAFASKDGDYAAFSLEAIDNFYYFNTKGELVKEILGITLIHELIHAIDNIGDLTSYDEADLNSANFDQRGPTVAVQNAIAAEMGWLNHIQASYPAAMLSTDPRFVNFTTETSYTEGNAVDVVRLGGDTVDTVNHTSNTTNTRDLIFGLGGDDAIQAGAGDDYVYGGNDADTISGNDGNDFLSGQAGNDNIFGGDGADRLLGGAGNDLLMGEGGNDVFDDGDGDDQIYAGGGDDLIKIGAGANIVDGGAGHDTVSFELSAAAVHISLGSTGIAQLFANVEVLVGSHFDDEFARVGSPTTTDLEIHGGAGNDQIAGGAGTNLLFGDDGDDTFNLVTGATSTITGGAGFDTVSYIDASAGLTFTVSDTGASGLGTLALNSVEKIIASNLADHITLSGGGVAVEAAGGADVITVTARGFTVDGGAGNDLIDATAADPRGQAPDPAGDTSEWTDEQWDAWYDAFEHANTNTLILGADTGTDTIHDIVRDGKVYNGFDKIFFKDMSGDDVRFAIKVTDHDISYNSDTGLTQETWIGDMYLRVTSTGTLIHLGAGLMIDCYEDDRFDGIAIFSGGAEFTVEFEQGPGTTRPSWSDTYFL